MHLLQYTGTLENKRTEGLKKTYVIKKEKWPEQIHLQFVLLITSAGLSGKMKKIMHEGGDSLF